ncbi:MAG TPA: DUF1553 domain-containing protein, partial [Luteolibacter sp.]|nr:DUF1553 domain-containing protein [Luteolibacter sp.]
LPTRDYYQLSAFFNSIDESGIYDKATKVPSPTLLLPTPEQEAQLQAAKARLVQAEDGWRKAMSAGDAGFEEWLKAGKPAADIAGIEGRYGFDAVTGGAIANEVPGATRGAGKLGGATLVKRDSGSALALDGDHGASFEGVFAIERWTPFTLALELRDPQRAKGPVVVVQKSFGTDSGYNGFDLMLADGYLEARLYRIWPGNGIGVRSAQPIARDRWQHVAVSYDGSSRAGGLALHVDGRRIEVEVLRDKMVKNTMERTFGSGGLTLGARFRDRGFAGGNIDHLVLATRQLSDLEIRCLAAKQPLPEVLAATTQREELRQHHQLALDEGCRAAAQSLQEARRAVVAAEDQVFEIPVMEELPQPRETHVLARGAYDAPKDDSTRVGRNTPVALPPLQARGTVPDRLDLARWLTQPDHPLTARVFVNRLWANFFGRGLAATPDNFGLQGSLPTHPQLLDWLARDFVDHGWDIKRLCRNIVLSRTYGQDSVIRPALKEKDPDNLLLARGPAHRLAAEQIRDLALSASGLLDASAGGPPVSPYQPGVDLWRESNSMSPPFKQSVGKALYRRSLYSVWKRTAPLPNMVAFDAGSREVCSVSRSRTNTPMQALVMLNDVQFIEAARVLAQSVHDADAGREIDAAFLRVAGRAPRAVEREVLVKLHADQLARFRDDPAAAKAMISHGESKADAALPVEHLAASTSVCLAILNLDAALWKR